MTADVSPRLATHLRGLRSDLAGSLYHIIAHSGFVSLDSTELQKQLARLADQVCTALLAEPFSRRGARLVGEALAGLRYLPADGLGPTLEALGDCLVAGLAAEDVAALQPRLTALLSEIAAGFARQEQATARAEHGAIYEILLAERRRAEEAVRASEERYRAVMTQAAEGIVLADAGSGRILEANPAFLELVGHQAEEVVGMPVYEVVAHDARSVDENIGRALRQGRIVLGERYYRRRDGSLVPVEASVIALDTGGGPVLCSVVRDISWRAQAEAEQAEVRRKLAEAREVERLRLAQELHDAVVQELVALRYGIEDGTRGVAEGRTAGELVPGLESIGERLAGVVGELRAVIGELRPIGLAELGLEGALENYVAHLEATGDGSPSLGLTVDLAGTILRDSTALCLFRVAQEAVRNALTHAEARCVDIRLRARTRQVILRVSDDGRGFSVPSRLGALTRDNHFGLAGMQERVEWAQGRLRVRSRPGVGTTVTVWVPRPDGGAGDD